MRIRGTFYLGNLNKRLIPRPQLSVLGVHPVTRKIIVGKHRAIRAIAVVGYGKAFNAPLAHTIHPLPQALWIDAVEPGIGLGWKSLRTPKDDIAMQCFTVFC